MKLIYINDEYDQKIELETVSNDLSVEEMANMFKTLLYALEYSDKNIETIFNIGETNEIEPNIFTPNTN